jgi:hypothetical protein
MSVHVSAYVWEHSEQKGTSLLLLLAIADMAHQNGVAFPSARTLARRIRMSERNTIRVLKTLIASGELRAKPNAGPNGTNLLQVVMNTTLPLFRGGDNLAHDNLSGDTEGRRGVTKTTTRGDTAMSPEPTEQKKNRIGRGAAPSAVSACFAAYAEGIKAKYGAEYPSNAKANGMLSQVVARVGAAPALAVVQFYVASRDPWYAKVRHSLEYLLRDCERLWMDVQLATGASGARKPPTSATAAFLDADGKVKRDLGEQPLAGPEEVARHVLKHYTRIMAAVHPKYVEVRLGTERRVFTIEELQEAAHA